MTASFSLGDKSPAALLVAVLDPNRAVETRYINYSAVTQSGRANDYLFLDTASLISPAYHRFLKKTYPRGCWLAEPPKELKGFDRLRIRARHSKTGQILLTDRDFSHWATGSGWAVNGGCYGVRVGSSSRDLQLGAVISLEGAGCGRGAIRAPGPG